MQQLQEFFQKQEAFNARVEESLQQRVEETGQRRQTRRLPNAVMVSSLFFAIVVVTSNVYSFCGIFTLLKFSAKTISSSCREVRGSGGWKLNYGYCFQNCEYSKISETSGNSDSVSTQVAGLTLVTRALATCTPSGREEGEILSMFSTQPKHVRLHGTILISLFHFFLFQN